MLHLDAQVPGEPLVAYNGRIVILGFGSIGSGVLPLLLRHVALPASSVTIVTAPDRGLEAKQASQRYMLGGVVICALTPDNYVEVRLTSRRLS